MKHPFYALLLLSCSYLVVACNNNPQQPQVADAKTPVAATVDSAAIKIEKNKATAIAAIEGFSNHNAQAVFKDIAPDYVDYGDGTDPGMKNKDSLITMVDGFFKAFPDMKADNITTMTDKNTVAVFATWTGTFKGELMGMKPTGKSFKYDDVDIFTFNDAGQLTSHRGTQSMKTVSLQVGMPIK
jgi:predicted ester cyclase